MKITKMKTQPEGKAGCGDSIHKRAYLRLATELLNHSKKRYALLKIYHGTKIALAGFSDLFKRAKQ